MDLTGNYAALSEDPNTYRVGGFIPPPEGEGPGPRSFNLDESELTVASNVDPYFFAQVTAAIQGDNSIDILIGLLVHFGGRETPTLRPHQGVAARAVRAKLGPLGGSGDARGAPSRAAARRARTRWH